jgi:hypothetical protein
MSISADVISTANTTVLNRSRRPRSNSVVTGFGSCCTLDISLKELAVNVPATEPGLQAKKRAAI